MIGKTIKSIITTDVSLIALVPAVRMFPYVMNEDTPLPALVYTIDSIAPDYNKGGWANDSVSFSIHSFARSYDSLQSIVSAVRSALEMTNTGSGTQDIGMITLISFEEGYDQGADVFYNKLTFNLIINTY